MAMETTERPPIDAAFIRGWFARFKIELSDEEANDFVEAAAADATESLAWMPYYKMSLSALAQSAGIMRGALARGAITGTVRQGLVAQAARAWLMHLLLAGSGPTLPDDQLAAMMDFCMRQTKDFADPEIAR